MGDILMPVWKNIRPRLEGTIRLRREAHVAIERSKVVPKRELKIRQHAAKILGAEKYLTSSLVLEMPRATRLILKEDASYEITEADLETLGEDIMELNIIQKSAVLEDAAVKLKEARRECGLEELPTNIDSLSEQLEVNINKQLLCHPTAIGISYDKSQDFYIVSLKKMLRLNALTFSSPCHFSDPMLDLECEDVDRYLLHIADALYDSVDIDAKTVADASALGCSFLCLRCKTENQVLFGWKDLVRVVADPKFLITSILKLQILHFWEETYQKDKGDQLRR